MALDRNKIICLFTIQLCQIIVTIFLKFPIITNIKQVGLCTEILMKDLTKHKCLPLRKSQPCCDNGSAILSGEMPGPVRDTRDY